MAHLLTLLTLLATTAASPLEPAEQAFAARDYQHVLPALDAARKHALSPTEALRADELEALTDAAFDETGPAIAAFRHALVRDPGYQPPASASPKIRGLFDEAHRQELVAHPLAAPALTQAPQVFASPVSKESDVVAPAPPVWKRWWFWAAAVVVVAGSAAAVTYEAQPRFPAGSLGRGALP